MSKFNTENNKKDQNERDLFWTFAKFIGIPIFLLFMFYFGVKMVRNQDYVELSKRFIRNNQTIKQEIGKVHNFGEFSGKINQSKVWEISGIVYGNGKNLEVKVTGKCSRNQDAGIGCNIWEARFRNASSQDEWIEIPIDWIEKATLNFK